MKELSESINEEKEDKLLKLCFSKNAFQLRNLYKHYASLGHNGPIDFNIILLRLFLSQLYRDIGLTNKYSMAEINARLFQNEDIGFELMHSPFEKIYYWQFLHCLVELSLITFDRFEKVIDYRKNGILASNFQIFLNNLIEKVEENKENIYNPFMYFNLLPIESVYLYYESIGQPHTVRKFLKLSCIETGSTMPCYFKSFDWKMIRDEIQGVNIVPVGENLTFYPSNIIYTTTLLK